MRSMLFGYAVRLENHPEQTFIVLTRAAEFASSQFVHKMLASQHELSIEGKRNNLL